MELPDFAEAVLRLLSKLLASWFRALLAARRKWQFNPESLTKEERDREALLGKYHDWNER